MISSHRCLCCSNRCTTKFFCRMTLSLSSAWDCISAFSISSSWTLQRRPRTSRCSSELTRRGSSSSKRRARSRSSRNLRSNNAFRGKQQEHGLDYIKLYIVLISLRSRGTLHLLFVNPFLFGHECDQIFSCDRHLLCLSAVRWRLWGVRVLLTFILVDTFLPPLCTPLPPAPAPLLLPARRETKKKKNPKNILIINRLAYNLQRSHNDQFSAAAQVIMFKCSTNWMLHMFHQIAGL